MNGKRDDGRNRAAPGNDGHEGVSLLGFRCQSGPTAGNTAEGDQTVLAWILQFIRFVDGLPAMHRDRAECKATLSALRTSVNETLRAQGQSTARLVEEISKLCMMIEELVRANQCLENASKQQMVLEERHYEERIIDPLVNSLIPLIDLTDDTSLECSGGLESILASLLKLRDAWRVGLEQFLAIYGVELYSSEARTPFNPRTMQPFAKTLTDDKDLHQKVARSARCGVSRGERILRVEKVVLYQLKPAASGLDARTLGRKGALTGSEEGGMRDE